MAIKVLKLTSVEDVIGDYEEKDGQCIINKPAKIVMFPTEQGGMGMMMLTISGVSTIKDSAADW